MTYTINIGRLIHQILHKLIKFTIRHDINDFFNKLEVLYRTFNLSNLSKIRKTNI